jgi:phosphoketolase
MSSALSPERLADHRCSRRTANDRSVGQIDRKATPRREVPLEYRHRHDGWEIGGTTPGLDFICVSLEGIMKAYDLNMIYIFCPGYGGLRVAAQTCLEGSYRARSRHRA